VSRFPEETVARREHTRRSFTAHFGALGYAGYPSEPLIPRDDESLLFTNSTIVAVKRLIERGGVPRPGFVLQQACLRTQNLKETSAEVLPEFMSYFHMLTVQVHPTVAPMELLPAIGAYFTDADGLEPDRILLRASEQVTPWALGWTCACPGSGLELDTRPATFYRWKYGMDDVVGNGVTVAIRQDAGHFCDIGNIVQLTRGDGGVVGYEFGFGIETYLSRRHSAHGPYQTSLASVALPFRPEPAWMRLQDALVCAVVLARHGLEPGPRGRSYVLHKTLKVLTNLRRRLGVELAAIEEAAARYERLEFGDDGGAAERVLEMMRRSETDHEDAVEKFRSQVHAARRRLHAVVFPELRAMGKSRYGLADDDMDSVIKRYFPGLIRPLRGASGATGS